MKPPFKPQKHYTNLIRDGREQTTAYMVPSIHEYVGVVKYGHAPFHKAIKAQESYTKLIKLLNKLGIYKHIPQ